jgi:hypothetical protein
MSMKLCQACITGYYPTPYGHELARIATNHSRYGVRGRTCETENAGG